VVVDPEMLSDFEDDFEERILNRFVKFRHSYNVTYGDIPLYITTVHREEPELFNSQFHSEFKSYSRDSNIFSNRESLSFWGQTRSYFLLPIEIMISMFRKILSKKKSALNSSFFSHNKRYQKVNFPYEIKQYSNFANDTIKPFPFHLKNLPFIGESDRKFAKVELLYDLEFLGSETKRIRRYKFFPLKYYPFVRAMKPFSVRTDLSMDFYYVRMLDHFGDFYLNIVRPGLINLNILTVIIPLKI